MTFLYLKFKMDQIRVTSFMNGPFLPCQRIDLLQLLVPSGLVVQFVVLFPGSGFLHASTSSRCTGASCPEIKLEDVILE